MTWRTAERLAVPGGLDVRFNAPVKSAAIVRLIAAIVVTSLRGIRHVPLLVICSGAPAVAKRISVIGPSGAFLPAARPPNRDRIRRARLPARRRPARRRPPPRARAH